MSLTKSSLIPVLLVGWCLGWAPLAGEDPPPVKLPVNVANPDGSPRLNLQSANFRLKVNGQLTPHAGFLDAEGPTIVILAWPPRVTRPTSTPCARN